MAREFMLTLPLATQKRDQEVTQVHSKKIFCTTCDKRKVFFLMPLGFGRTFCVQLIHTCTSYKILKI